jgi:hypothetical protein
MPTGMAFAHRPRPAWSRAPPRARRTHIKPLDSAAIGRAQQQVRAAPRPGNPDPDRITRRAFFSTAAEQCRTVLEDVDSLLEVEARRRPMLGIQSRRRAVPAARNEQKFTAFSHLLFHAITKKLAYAAKLWETYEWLDATSRFGRASEDAAKPAVCALGGQLLPPAGAPRARRALIGQIVGPAAMRRATGRARLSWTRRGRRTVALTRVFLRHRDGEDVPRSVRTTKALISAASYVRLAGI